MKKLSVFAGFNRTNENKESHPCCCGGGHPNHQVGEPYSKTVFQCPLKCEGDKTYNVPGKCPVCNQSLEQVTEVEQHFYL